MNYIPIDEVINEVKIMYSSYFEAGFDLDESILYPATRYLIKLCSKTIHPIDNAKIDIINYKGRLPDNFYMLRKAYGSVTKSEFVPPFEYQPIVTMELKTDYKINHCDMYSCQDECGEHINLIQKLDSGTFIEYPHIFPVKTSVRTKYYKTKLPDFFKNSQEELDINNNEITTSFCEGTLFIEYFAVLKENGKIIIPDNEIIKNAFKEKYKEVILEYLIMNTTAPVASLFQFQVERARHAVAKMVNMIQTPEFYDLSKIQEPMYNTYNKINRGY